MELGVIDEERTNILDDIRYLESRIAVQRELIRKLSRMRSKGRRQPRATCSKCF